MIIMKMFDEKFKLMQVCVYKIFQKYLLGCFFFLKYWSLIGYLPHLMQPINNKPTSSLMESGLIEQGVIYSMQCCESYSVGARKPAPKKKKKKLNIMQGLLSETA